jgi:hypothetical protein
VPLAVGTPGGVNCEPGSLAPQPARANASSKLSTGRIRVTTGRANNISAVMRHPFAFLPRDMDLPLRTRVLEITYQPPIVL